jgi:3-oxoacyl-[acyl-carrier-protein] synthase II
MSHRVAITGMGLVTALGTSVGETWRNLIAGKSGARPVTLFDVSTCRGQTAASVEDLTLPPGLLNEKQSRHLDRAGRMLLIAAHEAFRQASYFSDTQALKHPGTSLRAMLVLGTTGGGMRSGELFHRQLIAGKGDATAPRLLQNYLSQKQAIDLQTVFGVEGPILTTANACATGSNAVGYGFHLVRSGQWDVVICAGYDALSELIFAGFDSLQAMTTSLCRPFEKNRNGLVLGEGAAVLVLESLDHARQRGASLLGEVAGYGQSIDTHHLTQPHPEGDGALLCMQRAIASASLTTADIDHINAHGTATPQNDAMEAKAIRRCFDGRADEIPVTSVKAAIGHLLGGAGAAEAIVSVLSLQHQIVPPTLHYETPDPACNVAIVGNTARPHRMRTVLSNSFGFGGTNAALVFRKGSDETVE